MAVPTLSQAPSPSADAETDALRDLGLERHVLGSLLEFPQPMWALYSHLGEHDFWLREHQELYAAIRSVNAEGGVGDIAQLRMRTGISPFLLSELSVHALRHGEENAKQYIKRLGMLRRAREAYYGQQKALARLAKDPQQIDSEFLATMRANLERLEVEATPDGGIRLIDDEELMERPTPRFLVEGLIVEKGRDLLRSQRLTRIEVESDTSN